MAYSNGPVARRRVLLQGALGGAILVLGGVPLALSGCGSGGGTQPLPGGGTGGDPGGDTGGQTGDGGGPLTVERRLAVLDAVADFIAPLERQAAMPQAERNRRVLEYLQGRPEFAEAGMAEETENVWARFTDGRPYVYLPNWDRVAGVPPIPRLRPTQPAAGRAAADDLPAGMKAWFLDGLGWHHSTPDEEAAAMLNEHGYTAFQNVLTLEVLRSVKGAGVLHINAHGGGATLVKDKMAIDTFSTVTPYTAESERDPIIEDDFAHNRLAYAQIYHDLGDLGMTKVYAIGPEFLRHYVTFVPNAFVFLDGCWTGSEGMTKRLLPVLFEKGVSLYAGWSAKARSDESTPRALFLYDRLLGANAEGPKEKPRQRPFDYRKVHADMQRKGLHIGSEVDGRRAEIRFIPNPGAPEFGLLAPSIKLLDVDEHEGTLTLHGTFGHRKESVTVGGTDLSVRSWAPDKIVCTLPLTGPGAAGDVQVSVDQHKSNVRRITEWKGTLHKEMDFNVRLRADVGDYREEPGEAPRKRKVEFQFARDSTASATGSGSFDDGEFEYSFSGSMMLPYFTGDAIEGQQSGFIATGEIDTNTGKISLLLGGSGSTGAGETVIRPKKPGYQPVRTPFTCYFPIEAFPGMRFEMRFDPDHSVAADELPFVTFPEPFNQLGRTSAKGLLRWQRLLPRFAPDDETARHR